MTGLLREPDYWTPWDFSIFIFVNWGWERAFHPVVRKSGRMVPFFNILVVWFYLKRMGSSPSLLFLKAGVVLILLSPLSFTSLGLALILSRTSVSVDQGSQASPVLDGIGVPDYFVFTSLGRFCYLQMAHFFIRGTAWFASLFLWKIQRFSQWELGLLLSAGILPNFMGKFRV